MMEQGHLQVYDLTLTTKTPVFIGNGSKYQKYEYCFDSGIVSFLDQTKFFEMLAKRNLVERYETYIFSRYDDLNYFLRKQCSLTDDDMRKIIRYAVDATDSLDESHSLKEVSAFMRAPDGTAYIPGSSVKGALRTILLNNCLVRGSGQSADLDLCASDYAMRRQTQQIESKYLNTLKCNTRNGSGDAVNSIMRGIQISDSTAIRDADMMLASKYDVSVQGKEKKIPLCRECVKPETAIRFKLTLDQSILKGKITIGSLRRDIDAYDAYYHDTYVSRFIAPVNNAFDYAHYIVLGGGSGYFSKTFAYPYMGYKTALKRVSQMMERKFWQHHHDMDVELGVSPHTFKYTKYNDTLMPFGICEVDIR